jgi:tetratricopeptide (TPR) repeat protein
VRRSPLCRFAALLVALAALAASVGCGADGEFVRRFEAERLRWRADREEVRLRAAGELGDRELSVILRARHGEIALSFGASEPPSAGELDNEDTRLRYRIAGASALYRADLGARFGSSEEALGEYEEIARVYGFDRELACRARLGEGRVRERTGDLAGALTSFEQVLAIRPAWRVSEDAQETEVFADPLLLDLEIHCLLLLRETSDPARFRARLAEVEGQARERIVRAGTEKIATTLAQRLAEILFLEERWAEGCAQLEQAAGKMPAGGERASLLVRLGEVRRDAMKDPEEAEAAFDRAADDGLGTPVAAQARLRLAQLIMGAGRAAEALAVVEDVLATSPSRVEMWRAEALLTKARCLKTLGRWEDALPVLASVPAADPASPLGLVALEEMVIRMRSLYTPELAVQGAEDAVAVAERVPPVVPPVEPRFSWDEWRRARTERERWKEAVSFLRAIEEWWPDAPFASAALEQGVRLANERAHDESLARRLAQKIEQRRSRIAQD